MTREISMFLPINPEKISDPVVRDWYEKLPDNYCDMTISPQDKAVVVVKSPTARYYLEPAYPGWLDEERVLDLQFLQTVLNEDDPDAIQAAAKDLFGISRTPDHILPGRIRRSKSTGDWAQYLDKV